MKDLEIHLNAPEGASPEELAAYLDEACGNDAALRARVDALFAADVAARSDFLEAVAPDVGTTMAADSIQTASEAGSGAVIGRYKLLEKLGEGGFGSVWAAEQREPVKRRVALKIVKLGMDTKQVVARFEAERQALALMDHPNIAKVLDAGTTEAGRPYFVMELVKGVPITKFIEQERVEVTEKLQLFIRICQAIQHAHQKGVIHRDIKPSNVMITLHDGEPVPKVIDFGIAKATQGELTDKTIYTQYSQFIGTPAYMSPEQAEMSGLDIDTRSDIYSLGVLLYEMLTGATPFDSKELMASGLDEMRKIIRERDPVKPSTRLTQARDGTPIARDRDLKQEALASDLDWIVLKCLEKDRSRRYETANGLARDLGRHLNDEPIVARPPSIAYRVQKAWRRHRLALTASASVLVMLVVALGISSAFWHGEREARVAEQTQREEADILRRLAESNAAESAKNERQARINLYASDIQAADHYIKIGNLGAAREILASHREEVDLLGWEWRYLWGKSQGEQLKTFRGHTEAVQQVKFLPNGRLLSLAYEGITSDQSELILWDWREGRRVKSLRLPGVITEMVLLERRNQIALKLKAGGLQLWDENLTRPQDECPRDEVRYLAYSPADSIIYFSEADSPDDNDGKVFAWDLDGGGRVVEIEGPRGSIEGLSADGERLVLYQGGKEPILWDVKNKVASGRIPSPGARWRQGGLTSLRDDNGWIYAARNQRPRVTFDEGQPWFEPFPEAESGLGNRQQVAFSPDRDLMATGSYNHDVKIWDLSGLREKKHLTPLRTSYGHQDEVWCVDFSPDGQYLASGGQDRLVLLWSTVSRELDRIPVRGSAVAPVFSENSRLVALPSNLGVGILDLAARSEIQHVPGLRLPLAFTDSDTQILTISTNRLDYYSLKSGELVDASPFESGSLVINAGRRIRGKANIRMSQNLLMAPSGRGQITVRRRQTGETLFLIDTEGENTRSAAISPDERSIAVSLANGQIQLWDVAAQSLNKTIKAHRRLITQLQFMKDSRRLVAWSVDSDVTIWDCQTGSELNRFAGHKRGCLGGDISPDEKTLLSASDDRTLKLWHIATDREMASIDTRWPMWFARFSPDGRYLVAYGQSNSCHIWEAKTLEEIGVIK